MKVVFISGPFRSDTPWNVEQNIRRAEALALKVWQTGYFAVHCPHTNTRFFDGAAPDRTFLEGDLEIMRRCDAVLMVEGWERSEGARTEKSVAEETKIPVFTNLDKLVSWALGSATTEQ